MWKLQPVPVSWLRWVLQQSEVSAGWPNPAWAVWSAEMNSSLWRLEAPHFYQKTNRVGENNTVLDVFRKPGCKEMFASSPLATTAFSHKGWAKVMPPWIKMYSRMEMWYWFNWQGTNNSQLSLYALLQWQKWLVICCKYWVYHNAKKNWLRIWIVIFYSSSLSGIILTAIILMEKETRRKIQARLSDAKVVPLSVIIIGCL